MMVAIRPMTVSDVADGIRLKAEAGWNQVPADWRRLSGARRRGLLRRRIGRTGRRLGDVVPIRIGRLDRDASGREGRRGQGVGGTLLRHALRRLEAAGARSIRLDATRQGRPLYESLGFRVDFHLDRYVGIPGGAAIGEGARIATSADLARLADLDRAATGTDRRILLDRLIHDNPCESLVAPADRGFVLWRSGASADQVGPCIAERDVGRALLDEAARRLAGRRVIVDVPTENIDAVAWAEKAGLKPTREFWRMTRGEPVVEDQGRIWASSGPEMG